MLGRGSGLRSGKKSDPAFASAGTTSVVTRGAAADASEPSSPAGADSAFLAEPAAGPVSPTPPFSRQNRIVVPAEKRGILLEEMSLPAAIDTVMAREGYVVLGDLDGRTLAELGKHRGMGITCLRRLHHALVPLSVVVSPPPVETPSMPRLDVPAFAAEYRLNELPLRHIRRQWTVLGELQRMPLSELRRLKNVGVESIRELESLLTSLHASGPPAPAGLLDLLDAALDGLPEERRRVLLQRFGGAGEAPLTLAEIGRRHARTGSWISMLQGKAFAKLRVLAGPEFGRMLRDVERHVSAGEAELASELARVGRVSAHARPPKPWEGHPFYERLLAELAPGLRRGTPGTWSKMT